MTAPDNEAARMARTSYRVAYVIGELTKGGAEYQLYELLRHLDREQFEPRVFALAADGCWSEPIRQLGIEVREMVRRGSADVGRLLRLRAELRAFKPDLLHTMMWPANTYGRLAAARLGIPVVVAAERVVPDHRWWQVLVDRVLDRTTDAYLVNCNAIAGWLAETERLAYGKITVIPNGIDLSRLPAFSLDRQAARREAGRNPARRLVAQVARLESQKDWPTFLRAAAMVAAELPDVDFLAVGDGTLREELEALSARLGLTGRICFTGLCDNVPALLAGVDVLALTSTFEGFPNVLLEAMATGAVAIATDVGGCRELVSTGETGLLVPPRAPAAVAAAVTGVLRDGALARRLALAARRRVESGFAVDLMAERTMAFYRSLLRFEPRAGVHRGRVSILDVAAGNEAREDQGTPRLVVVCSQFPEANETFVVRELGELRRRGFVLTVLSLRPPPRVLDPEARELVPFTVYPPGVRGILRDAWRTIRRRPRGALRALRVGLGDVLAARSTPLVALKQLLLLPLALAYGMRLPPARYRLHAQFANVPTAVARVLAGLRGGTYSFTAHAWDIYVPANRRQLPARIAGADRVVTCTVYNQKLLASLAPGPEDAAKIMLCHHGLSLSRYEPGDRRTPDLVVGGASLVEQKGLTYLVAACARLRAQGRRVRCVLIGEGPERTRLEQQIRALDLCEQVQLVGQLPHRDVIRYLREAAVFAHPSIVERRGAMDGIPNTILEALALETPVVGTRISGIPEVVLAEVTGLLVEPADVEGLTEALARLLADPVLGRRLGAAGRRLVLDGFDLRRNIEPLTCLFSAPNNESPGEP